VDRELMRNQIQTYEHLKKGTEGAKEKRCEKRRETKGRAEKTTNNR
jgi:hypothetical protein